MARRKATQKKSRKQAAPKSRVEARKVLEEILPRELIHLVFTYLQPTEAAAFRWSGRRAAVIGLQYLAPTVYLALKEESYDRLLAIAEHPIVSKYVVKLDYESEGLGCISRKSFDENVQSTRVIPQRYDSERPDTFASARAWRAYERELIREKRLLSQEQTTQLLDRAWSIHKEYFTDQSIVNQGSFFLEKTAKAMKQFQNLQSICAFAYGAYERYTAELKELLPTYYIPPRVTNDFPSSLNPTCCVLLAAGSARLRVNEFCCEPIDWDVFTLNDQTFAALKRSMLHVKFMKLAFEVRRDLGQQPMIRDIESIRREYLANGRVLDFLMSAPDLENLRLTFRTSLKIYATVIATLGDFHWSSLKAVSLDHIATDGNDLVNFCERHSCTLKDLSLSNIVLYKVSWAVTFHRVRQAFRLGQQLHTCELGGQFWDSRGSLFMETRSSRFISVGVIISGYIRASNVGDISFGKYCDIIGLGCKH